MTARPRRLISLDVFRGLCIAGMMLVNNPGNWNAVFPPLTHSAWHGCTFADLIFPFFIFIMGVAMPLAFARRRDRAAPLLPRIVTRAALLVALGVGLNLVTAWPHLGQARWPGVLQRIGLTYAAAAWLILRLPRRGQWLAAAALLLGHWAAFAWIPFGGYPAGVLTPEANLGAHVDLTLFGGHTLTASGDPEGLLGLASSIATALLGAAAGWWLQTSADPRRWRRGLILGGVAGVLVGLAWSTVWPLNKALWTGSYALFTSGLAALALAACDGLLESPLAAAAAQPFLWLGVRPLSMYVLSEFVAKLAERPLLHIGGQPDSIKDALFWQVVAPLVGDHGGMLSSALYGAVYTALWIAIAGWLARQAMHSAQ